MTKKKIEEVKEEITPVFISQECLREIDRIEANTAKKRSELEMLRLKVKHATTELTLISANYTLKSKEKLELEQTEKRIIAELTEKQNEYRKYIKELAEKYSLPEKFGYDHITGEVK